MPEALRGYEVERASARATACSRAVRCERGGARGRTRGALPGAKLPSVRRLYPELVRQATQDGWDYEEFLLQLLEVEVLTRRDGAVARLLRRLGSPTSRPSSSSTGRPCASSARVAQLATCAYIEAGLVAEAH